MSAFTQLKTGVKLKKAISNGPNIPLQPCQFDKQYSYVAWPGHMTYCAFPESQLIRQWRCWALNRVYFRLTQHNTILAWRCWDPHPYLIEICMDIQPADRPTDRTPPLTQPLHSLLKPSHQKIFFFFSFPFSRVLGTQIYSTRYCSL